MAGLTSESRLRWRSISAGRWTALVTLLLVAPLLATTLRFPLLVMEPGPAPDIADRSEILTPTFESSGSFHLTTVQIRRPGGSTLFEAMQAMFASDKFLVSRSAVYPPGGSDEQANQVQSAQMVQSEVSAAAVAFDALGIEYEQAGALVIDVLPGSPASEVLEPGDVITEVDGQPVTGIDELIEAIAQRSAGETLAVTLTRDGAVTNEQVRTVQSQEEPARTVMGVQISQHHRAPIDINFDAADIGGPSAGLMFALSIYDRLEEGDLTGGKKIAGTGTLDATDGSRTAVGGVGAVELKVRGAMQLGADVFVVPQDSVEKARSLAGSSMQVIGVSTFEEAIAALEAL
ncbi:MAG: PDZ domain-containing protein [Actinomycetota bacterium]